MELRSPLPLGDQAWAQSPSCPWVGKVVTGQSSLPATFTPSLMGPFLLYYADEGGNLRSHPQAMTAMSVHLGTSADVSCEQGHQPVVFVNCRVHAGPSRKMQGPGQWFCSGDIGPWNAGAGGVKGWKVTKKRCWWSGDQPPPGWWRERSLVGCGWVGVEGGVLATLTEQGPR